VRQVRWQMDTGSGLQTDPASGMRRDPDTGSTAERRGGVWVVHLRGLPFERGQAHGRLLRTEINASRVAPYFSRFLRELYESTLLARSLPSGVRSAVGELLEWWFYAPLEHAALEETRLELAGVAEGAGLDERTVLRGTLAPDIMQHLVASFLPIGKEALGNYYLGGCSAFYVRRTARQGGGSALLARNMDFPGALVWKHPAVIVTHPEEEVEAVEGSEAEGFRRIRRRKDPYVYVSVAGFPGFGLTGMSASGVAFGTFVCLSKNVSRRSLPSLDFNHYLFTRARSLEGIVHLLRSERLRSASPHAVLFADGYQALSVEVDGKRSEVRTMPLDFDTEVQTNHFLHPLMRRREMEFPLEREYTIGRLRLLRDAIQENYGRINVQRAVDLISCNLDLASGSTRLLGDFPAQAATLTSVIFEPGHGNFWVADGVPPAVCYNTYRGFNLFDELEGRGARTRLPSYRRSRTPVLQGTRFRPVGRAARSSLRYLTLSQEVLKRGKVHPAVRHLERAIALCPDPGYEVLLGILCLLDGQDERALETFRRVRGGSPFPPVKAQALALWEARALDLLGRRAEARECYRELLAEPALARDLGAAARRSLRRPFRRSRLPRTLEYYLLGPMEF
jgi:tetratricopeptide (TPR) repeat protein